MDLCGRLFNIVIGPSRVQFSSNRASDFTIGRAELGGAAIILVIILFRWLKSVSSTLQDLDFDASL